MRLDAYLYDNEIEQDAMNLLEVAIFFEEFGRLDEGVMDFIKDIKGKADKMFKKAGFHTSQSKGMIQYLYKINKNILVLFYNAMLYSTGSESEKMKAKEAINAIKKSVTREEIINFLYKLDMLTLHSFTTPLKVIDALTGWHIAGEVKSKVEPAISKAKKAIEWLESTKDHLTGKLKVQLQKYVNAIRRVFDIGDFKKATA